jgi:hypothetical protein
MPRRNPQSIAQDIKDYHPKPTITLCELLSTKIRKSKRTLYATPRRWAWFLQHNRNKVLQVLVNRWMIGLPPKPKEVWDSWKKRHPNP